MCNEIIVTNRIMCNIIIVSVSVYWCKENSE